MTQQETRAADPMALAEKMFPSTVMCIAVAARHRLADLLADGPLDLEQLAENSGTRPRPLSTVLRLLAADGVFAEVAPGRFANTDLSRLLGSGVPGSLQAMACLVGESWLWSSWGGLDHTVTSGDPAFDRIYGTTAWAWFAQNPGPARLFDRAMTDFSEALGGCIASAYPDFGSARVVADLGGGQGSYLATILERHPAVGRGVLVDLPAVVEQAAGNPRFRALLEQGRAELFPSDFFVSVPAAVDLYVSKQIMHSWPDDRLERLLHRCRTTSPQARVVAAEMVQDEAASHFVSSFDLVMMITMRGGIRSAGQFADVFGRAGYRLKRIVPTGTAFSLIEAVPAI
jgi:hypothetical protein